MISKAELTDFLQSRGVMPFEGSMMADSNYSLPAWDWVVRDFAPAFGRMLGHLGATEWKPESGDCDDFARLAAAYASLIHRRTGNLKSGLAFGEFWFVRRDNVAHAVNIAVCREDGELAMHFFEPQDQTETKLNQEEIDSCLGLRF